MTLNTKVTKKHTPLAFYVQQSQLEVLILLLSLLLIGAASEVGVAISYVLDGPGFELRWREETFSSPYPSRPFLIQPLLYGVPKWKWDC